MDLGKKGGGEDLGRLRGIGKHDQNILQKIGKKGPKIKESWQRKNKITLV